MILHYMTDVMNTKNYKYWHDMAVLWLNINYLQCLFLNGENLGDMSFMCEIPDGAAICKVCQNLRVVHRDWYFRR